MHSSHILACFAVITSTISASPLSAYGEELTSSSLVLSTYSPSSSTHQKTSTKADLSVEATSETSSLPSSQSTTSHFIVPTGKPHRPTPLVSVSGHIVASGTVISGASLPTTVRGPYSKSTCIKHHKFTPSAVSGVSGGASLSHTAGANFTTSSIPAGIFPSGGPGSSTGCSISVPLRASAVSSSLAGPLTVTITAPAITITSTETVTFTVAASQTNAVITPVSGRPSLSAYQSAPYPIANATVPHPTASGHVSGSISLSRPSGSAVASHPSASKPVASLDGARKPVTHTRHRISTKTHNNPSKTHQSASVAVSVEATTKSSSSKTSSESSSSSSVTSALAATLSSYM